VDIEGGWAQWLGSCITDLPTRLSAGSTKKLNFRGRIPPAQYSGGSLAVFVGLGNGQTVLARIKLTEDQLADIDSIELAKDLVNLPERSAQLASPIGTSSALGDYLTRKARLLLLHRAGDADAESALLSDHLKRTLTSWIVTTQITTDEPGINTLRYAESAARGSDAILLLIGPSWLRLTKQESSAGARQQEDQYMAALRAALSSNAPLIPVLLAGSDTLRQDELPPELAEITFRNSIDLREDRHDEQMLKLIKHLEKMKFTEYPSGISIASDEV